MGEVIVITSGKGGVGKTTSVANIGCALAQSGKKVVMLDADVGLRNLDIIMGLEDRIVFDFVDVIEGKCRLKQALVKDKRFSELYLLAASQTKNKADVAISGVKKLINELKESFDYVIIDCAAGIEYGFETAVSAADRAIVVATPEITSVRDADRVLDRLDSMGIKAEILINKVRPLMVKKGTLLGVDNVIEALATELLGVIPDDEEIIASSNSGVPVVLNKDCVAGMAYMNTAKRIMGEKVPVLDFYNPKKRCCLFNFRK
ncbi:MAG: septum site-determining protein MinD [Clostridia bacterium]|nr:septum site-determining protein MinD [Clostridia bacterium]